MTSACRAAARLSVVTSTPNCADRACARSACWTVAKIWSAPTRLFFRKACSKMPPILPAPSTATRNPGIAGAGAKTGTSKLSLIPKGYQTLLLLRRNPRIDALLEHIHRQRSGIEHLVVKCFDIELRTQRRLRFVPQFEYLQLPHLVPQRLCRPRNIAVNLRLNIGLIERGVIVEVIHHLLSSPVLRMDACVHDQSYRPPHVVIES